MKLRFHANTLRLRLSQSEVQRLAEAGRVEETFEFAPGQSLGYAIESRPVEQISAGFDGRRIEIAVPSAQVATWIGSDQTGLERPDGVIVIEKDFQCLHREGEDADAFPNPLMDKF